MSAERLIANLLRVAHEDLDAARLLASAANRNAIYLCEQAAEKIIRAVLTSEGIHAGIKHHLDEMVALVPDTNPLKPALRSIEYLAAYATAYRYPTAEGRIKPSPSPQAVADALRKLSVALDAATNAHGVDLADREKVATKPGPHR
jgi:HEPN domain-containing protein